MSKKVRIILLSTLGAIFLALALYKVYSNVTAKKAFEIQVVNETSSSPLSEAEDLKIKKAKYYSIYSNGKIEKASPFKIKKQTVDVDPTILFDSYTQNNETRIKLKKKNYKLKDQNSKKVITDPNYKRLINRIVEDVRYEAYTLRLFKEGNSSYYAYYRINAGISNAGYLYYFNSKNGKFAKLCKLENGVVVRVKKLDMQY